MCTVSDLLYLVMTCSVIYNILDRAGQINLFLLLYQATTCSSIQPSILLENLTDNAIV